MTQTPPEPSEKRQFTPRATLVAIGIHLRQVRPLEPILQKVRIAQKAVKFSPLEKLTDALITILAGAHGLVEANKGSGPTPPSNKPSAVPGVRSNRSSRIPWTPAPPRMSSRW